MTVDPSAAARRYADLGVSRPVGYPLALEDPFLGATLTPRAGAPG